MSAYALASSFSFSSFPGSVSTELQTSSKGTVRSYEKDPDNCDASHNESFSSVSSISVSKNSILSNDGNEVTSSWRNKSDLLVTIKSASIDPIHLVQSFAIRRRSGSKESDIIKYSKQMNDSYSAIGSTRRGSIRNKVVSSSGSMNTISTIDDLEERDHFRSKYPSEEIPFSFEDTSDSVEEREDLDYRAFPGHASAHEGQSSSSSLPRTSRSENPSSSIANSQDGAIQFTLSINFNGRKYTATRALPSFIKLRNDLQRELSSRSEDNARCLRRGKRTRLKTPSTETKDTDSHLPQIGTDKIISTVGCSQREHEQVTSSDYSSKKDKSQENTFTIPELPIGNKENGGILEDLEDGAMAMVGFAGRGFTRLQATVLSYCPAMEDWLRNVTDLVPTSPSLANFLWEPIRSDMPVHQGRNAKNDLQSSLYLSCAPKKSCRSRDSVCTLDSINEDFYYDDEEDGIYEGELGHF